MMTHMVRRVVAPMLAVSACLTVTLHASVKAADAKAYLIQEIQVTDAVKFKDYAEQAPATVAAFGGVFIVRGGAFDVISGSRPEGRVVIIEFPSMAKHKEWRESAAYQKILPIRTANSTSRVYVVEGVTP